MMASVAGACSGAMGLLSQRTQLRGRQATRTEPPWRKDQKCWRPADARHQGSWGDRRLWTQALLPLPRALLCPRSSDSGNPPQACPARHLITAEGRGAAWGTCVSAPQPHGSA